MCYANTVGLTTAIFILIRKSIGTYSDRFFLQSMLSVDIFSAYAPMINNDGLNNGLRYVLLHFATNSLERCKK